jgi:hypothetical protein
MGAGSDPPAAASSTGGERSTNPAQAPIPATGDDLGSAAPRVVAANQLRAHLQVVFAAAACLFAEVDSEIRLRFRRARPVGRRKVKRRVLTCALSSVHLSYTGSSAASPEVDHE